MKEYRKSYRGLWLWIIGMCAAMVLCVFLPVEDVQVEVAAVDNVMTVSIFILSWIIYRKETVYWYNGVDYQAALLAGSARRKAYAMAHMKRFGIFAAVFLIYSILSILIGIPYGIDIAVVSVGLLAVAISTIKIHL